MIHNRDISKIFEDVADLMEINGDNPFRVRAYRQAARTVSTWPDELAQWLDRGKSYTEIKGIGIDLSEKITEIIQTGKLQFLDALKKKLPEDLLELLKIQTLGPKRVGRLYRELGVESVADLKRALKEDRVSILSGFGPKLIQKISSEIKRYDSGDMHRFRLDEVEPVIESLLTYIKTLSDVTKVDVAGSYRRGKETVGDVDILIQSEHDVMSSVLNYDEIETIQLNGKTRSTVVLQSGLQVDVRSVAAENYGAALIYFTGSKEHNVSLRMQAQQSGLKINEYGVFKGKKSIAGSDEKGVYQCLNLSWIPPELREDRGEFEAAKRKLPELITVSDIQGDLHAHTTSTDGRNTLSEMADAAQAKGYRYLAITDHTKHVSVANGMDEKRLRQQLDDIDALNETLPGITILKSSEVDILADGSLDLPNSVLKELDFTVCSIHYQFDQNESKQTERILRAMDNPYFSILGHPTGRLLTRRPGYPILMERILQGAKERGCYLEVNSQPKRLDLCDIHCQLAKEIGVKLAISTDAHATHHFGYIKYGVTQARRGWLTAEDVLNTRPLSSLLKLLRRA